MSKNMLSENIIHNKIYKKRIFIYQSTCVFKKTNIQEKIMYQTPKIFLLVDKYKSLIDFSFK
ncbi:MAG: hypothetical protein A2W97_17480 [Bacteroidetes bacterium GWE2_40_63]|nr:MAG: hypothetical protein A2W95_10855 [Bacteroidetes bacterium GWA2_40_14]OFX64075.1 MAG: hypothetical protein A2W84_01655 [Bacteroidetes bacterium GWC2_40_13]OFX71223.1 MAG: hypothetical protein A2W96_16310 [Bacteroidetes bacterium GWD2_40_43]OFX90288.1 MAG: hypothetical protein A2W97_17480 [Bacteroidetes bacterium GWE2_40_63]OFY22126.1 MAG: hypothetical protein A2W88_09095 [Bacteroidetes bacterium GWF2_40_13]OFZ27751.1 MAG: hypothetical protein A2437_02205 [Bacteroidetes bacterium RIFOXYC